MVIDTSAIIAVLTNDPERREFIEAIERSDVRAISSASILEASIVILHRCSEEGLRDLDLFGAKAKLEIKPVDPDQNLRYKPRII